MSVNILDSPYLSAQYRDDGLMVVKGSSRQAEVKKKEVAAILKSTGIGITISANLKTVDFLNLTLDLELGTYQIYNKPNNIPLYVHKQSSHSPNVTKNIAFRVNKILISNCSNEELFKTGTPIFHQAIKNSGYNHQLNYKQTNPRTKSKTSKNQNIIYFTPPGLTMSKQKLDQKY